MSLRHRNRGKETEEGLHQLTSELKGKTKGDKEKGAANTTNPPSHTPSLLPPKRGALALVIRELDSGFFLCSKGVRSSVRPSVALVRNRKEKSASVTCRVRSEPRATCSGTTGLTFYFTPSFFTPSLSHRSFLPYSTFLSTRFLHTFNPPPPHTHTSHTYHVRIPHRNVSLP
jgi:hypothetical protein